MSMISNVSLIRRRHSKSPIGDLVKYRVLCELTKKYASSLTLSSGSSMRLCTPKSTWTELGLWKKKIKHIEAETKMAAILLTIFSNAFSWIKMFVFKFVPEVPINDIPSLVQIMDWRRPGDKPLSEPMMVSLLTYKRHSASVSWQHGKNSI